MADIFTPNCNNIYIQNNPVNLVTRDQFSTLLQEDLIPVDLCQLIHASYGLCRSVFFIRMGFTAPFRTGVGNSFGFAGHIRDNLGICGPVHVLVN